MKIQFTVLLLLSGLFLSAQTQDVYVINQAQRYLKWSDQYYQNSFKGLKQLMSDLQIQDPELYGKLQSRYFSLVKQQKEAWIIMGAGGGVGFTMILVGLFPKKEKESTTVSSFDSIKTNWGLVGAGAGIVTIASIIGALKVVNQNDVLIFTNSFNQLSNGKMIEITLKPVLSSTNAGISLSIEF